MPAKAVTHWHVAPRRAGRAHARARRGRGLFVRTFGKLATLDIGLDKGPSVVDVDVSRTTRPGSEARPLRTCSGRGRSRSRRGRSRPVADYARQRRMERTGRAEGIVRGSDARAHDVPEQRHAWMVRHLRHRLRAGRDFDTRDVSSAPAVAIANETFIRRVRQGRPLGQIVRFERGSRKRATRSDRRGRSGCRYRAVRIRSRRFSTCRCSRRTRKVLDA